MAEKLEYTHVVAVQLPNDNDNLLGNQKWSKNKIDVYYGQAGLNIPIQNGVFFDTNDKTGISKHEINRDFISGAINYLYNKRNAEGEENFDEETKKIFGEGKNDDVLFLGMKKVNEIYTGHIVKKIAQDKMGLYSFEYQPYNSRSVISKLTLVEQVDAAASASFELFEHAKANNGKAKDAAKRAALTISELLSEITQSRVASSPSVHSYSEYLFL